MQIFLKELNTKNLLDNLKILLELLDLPGIDQLPSIKWKQTNQSSISLKKHNNAYVKLKKHLLS